VKHSDYYAGIFCYWQFRFKKGLGDIKDAPYIHTFKTSEQCYVYDVNTDKILRIPETVYNYLLNSSDSNVDEETISFVQNMKENGFLRPDRVEISEHPATSLLPYYMQNKLQQLILSVGLYCPKISGTCLVGEVESPPCCFLCKKRTP